MGFTEIPFVSVVIPTRNRRELLKDAIVSLFAQSYPKDRYEVIIVDNSSRDGTEEMVYSLQQGSPCVLHYYCKENEGPGSSRNLGIAKARGTIIAFTDSDCVADPHWLEHGVSRIADEVGLVMGKTLPNPHQPARTLQYTQKVLWNNGLYQTCNIFYRKTALENVGGFSPDFSGLNIFGQRVGDDTDLAWRVKEKGWKSVFTNNAVVYHHIYPLSIRRAIFNFLQINANIAFPRLVKRHPGLRNIIFYRNVFTSKQRALFYLLLLSLFPGMFIHWGFYLLGLPYVTRLLRVSFYRRPIWSYHRGFALFGIIIVHEIIESFLLICTSLIYRSVVL